MFQRLVSGAAAAALALGLAASPAAAAGFGIFEQGSRAMGMAGAFTAQADDPSALFHNAAGLAFLEERDFQVGFTYITFTESEFRGADPSPGAGVSEEQETLREFPPHAYWVEPINPTWSFGLGLTTPFGLTTEWQDPASFTGRFLSTRAALRAVDLNPTVGWRLSPRLGLGFGAIARFSDVELDRFVAAPIAPGVSVQAGRVGLESDFEPGFGWNAGLLYRANESFSWGLSYRSRVKIDYSGTARFTQISTGNPVLDAILAQRIPFDRDLDVETEIEFPDLASLGVMVALSRNTRLEVDVNWTGWSSFDEVPIDFVGFAPLSSTLEEEWDDVMNYRAGLRWMRPGGTEWRFGYVYDETPQPDEHVSPLLPDSDRNGFTVGWGRQFASTSVDLALMYLPFDERTTTTNADGYNGTYNTTSWLFGATFGF